MALNSFPAASVYLCKVPALRRVISAFGALADQSYHVEFAHLKKQTQTAPRHHPREHVNSASSQRVTDQADLQRCAQTLER